MVQCMCVFQGYSSWHTCAFTVYLTCSTVLLQVCVNQTLSIYINRHYVVLPDSVSSHFHVNQRSKVTLERRLPHFKLNSSLKMFNSTQLPHPHESSRWQSSRGKEEKWSQASTSFPIFFCFHSDEHPVCLPRKWKSQYGCRHPLDNSFISALHPSFTLFIFFALSLSLIIFPSFNYFAEICKNALNDLRKTAQKYFILTSLTNIVIVIEKVIIFFKPRGVFMEHISGFSQAQIFGVDCAWWHTWFLGNENVMRLLTYLSYYSFVLFLY